MKNWRKDLGSSWQSSLRIDTWRCTTATIRSEGAARSMLVLPWLSRTQIKIWWKRCKRNLDAGKPYIAPVKVRKPWTNIRAGYQIQRVKVTGTKTPNSPLSGFLNRVRVVPTSKLVRYLSQRTRRWLQQREQAVWDSCSWTFWSLNWVQVCKSFSKSRYWGQSQVGWWIGILWTKTPLKIPSNSWAYPVHRMGLANQASATLRCRVSLK